MSAGPRHRPPAHPDSTPEYTEGREEGPHAHRHVIWSCFQTFKQPSYGRVTIPPNRRTPAGSAILKGVLIALFRYRHPALRI